MFVVYNGIELPHCQVRQITRERIYNGSTWIYDRVLLHVSTIYNPQMLSYRQERIVGGVEQRPGVNAATKIAGIMPVYSDVAIRAALAMPRKRLEVYSWTNGPNDVNPPYILFVPGPDVNNGPLPLRFDVSEIHGTKTFRVEFVIQTDVRETLPIYSRLAAGQDPKVINDNASILLSHRWTQEQVIDDNLLSTVTTKGIAVFRTDLLESRGMTVDQFRDLLILQPPPFNRRRFGTFNVQNNNTLEYVVVDIQESYYLRNNFIVKAEILESSFLTRQSMYETVLKTMTQASGAMQGMRESVNNAPKQINVTSGQQQFPPAVPNSGTSASTTT